jgi:hypothetical protein
VVGCWLRFVMTHHQGPRYGFAESLWCVATPASRQSASQNAILASAGDEEANPGFLLACDFNHVS